MEIILGRRLTEAIEHIGNIQTAKAEKLDELSVSMNARRFEFFSRYTDNLSATAILLRAVQDPVTSTPEELVKIILEKPGIVACVRDFTTGKIPYPHLLSETVLNITVKTIQRSRNRY